jgi:hypothetical protein
MGAHVAFRCTEETHVNEDVRLGTIVHTESSENETGDRAGSGVLSPPSVTDSIFYFSGLYISFPFPFPFSDLLLLLLLPSVFEAEYCQESRGRRRMKNEDENGE